MWAACSCAQRQQQSLSQNAWKIVHEGLGTKRFSTRSSILLPAPRLAAVTLSLGRRATWGAFCEFVQRSTTWGMCCERFKKGGMSKAKSNARTISQPRHFHLLAATFSGASANQAISLATSLAGVGSQGARTMSITASGRRDGALLSQTCANVPCQIHPQLRRTMRSAVVTQSA